MDSLFKLMPCHKRKVVDKLIDELSALIKRVMASEDFVKRAEAYYLARHEDWPPGLAATFQDTLERKREQIDYEWHRVGRMGDAVANDLHHKQFDI